MIQYLNNKLKCKKTITGVFLLSSKQTNSPLVVLDPCNRETCRTTDSAHTDPEWRPLCLALCQVKPQNVTKRLSTAKELACSKKHPILREGTLHVYQQKKQY